MSNIVKRIVCYFKGHLRGKTKLKERSFGRSLWWIKCKRCGYSIEYWAPFVRDIYQEIINGFTGN